MPRKNRKEQYSKAILVGDCVGIAFFVVANVVLLIGELTDTFATLSARHGGLRYIINYLAAPVYVFLKPFVAITESDQLALFLAGEFVIIVTAMVYGVITFLIIKVAAAMRV